MWPTCHTIMVSFMERGRNCVDTLQFLLKVLVFCGLWERPFLDHIYFIDFRIP